jgi:fatty acid desaturase
MNSSITSETEQIASGAFIPGEDFLAEDRQSRTLVRELHQASPRIYWADLAFTSVVGWGAFAAACSFRLWSAPMFVCALVAVLALYRGLCFIHELTHLRARALPRFEMIWNALIGYPLLMPSFVYIGVHQNHHSLSTYGTKQDPEYMPFAQSTGMTTVFAVESFLIPVALLTRFLVLAIGGFLSGRVQRWLVVHFSSLTMNLHYRREASPELIRKVKTQSLVIWAAWAAVIGLAAVRGLPWRIFLVWLLVSSVISFINTLRTLGAHRYDSVGEPLDRHGQLLDSIDTPGAAWTELWAPVGLRYHALHHYFPGIPYHHLPEAYRRLTASLPAGATYHSTRSKSLPVSLRTLYDTGLRYAREGRKP